MNLNLVLVFLAGACIGSFLNVVLSRLPAGRQGLGRREGILFGRSECPHCHRVLAWYDLVPVMSFLFLRGRCRTCRARISLRYPVVELSTALVLTWFFVRAGLPAQAGIPVSPETILSAILLVGFLMLLFFDALYLLLPDAVTLPMIGVALVHALAFGSVGVWNVLGNGFLFAAGFGILYAVSGGRWIGFGDVKLALLIGILFGYPLGVVVVIGSVWIATLYGFGLLLLRRATLATALPFGAFLAGVAIVVIVFKNEAQVFFNSFS